MYTILSKYLAASASTVDSDSSRLFIHHKTSALQGAFDVSVLQLHSSFSYKIKPKEDEQYSISSGTCKFELKSDGTIHLRQFIPRINPFHGKRPNPGVKGLSAALLYCQLQDIAQRLQKEELIVTLRTENQTATTFYDKMKALILIEKNALPGGSAKFKFKFKTIPGLNVDFIK